MLRLPVERDEDELRVDELDEEVRGTITGLELLAEEVEEVERALLVDELEAVEDSRDPVVFDAPVCGCTLYERPVVPEVML